FDRAKFQACQAAELVVRVKNVAKHIAQELSCLGSSKQRNLPVAVVTQWAQVVDAENMIGMRVGVNDGVDPPDLFADGLLAEVRGGVGENEFSGEFEQDRRPAAPVVGIGRVADGAVAANGGHSHGSTAA